MATTPSSTFIGGNEFLIVLIVIIILRIRRYANGQRFSNRIFLLPAIYVLLIVEFVVFLNLEQEVVVAALALIGIPLGSIIGANPGFFFREGTLYFKRSFLLMMIWLGALIIRFGLEILYANPTGIVEFIITALLAITLGLIVGERVMIYRKGNKVLRTGKTETADVDSTLGWTEK